MEECGILKWALCDYLICEGCVSLSSVLKYLPSIFFCVHQAVSGLWTWRGIPGRQRSADSATRRLWTGGAVCAPRGPTVSLPQHFAHTLGAVEGASLPVRLFRSCTVLRGTSFIRQCGNTVNKRISMPTHLLSGSWRFLSVFTAVSVHWCELVIFIAAWRFETPQLVQFVEKLSDVVIGQLPNFWKLWISYVNGSLFSEVMSAEM